GLLPFAFKPDFGFRDYAEWALDVPMFFLVRDGVYRPARDRITFRRFLKEGFEGETATQADWETHLSTVFPEVRLKRTIEVRGAVRGGAGRARARAARRRGRARGGLAPGRRSLDGGARGPAPRGPAPGTGGALRRARAQGPGRRAVSDLGGGPSTAAGRRRRR